MLEGVPVGGGSVFVGEYAHTNLQTPPSHLRCATSSTLEEEIL